MKNKQINKHQEFSKRIINAMTFLWFLVALFDMGVVVWLIAIGSYESIQMMLSDLLTFVGVPISGGILAYYIKAAVENKEKIKGSREERIDEDGNDI